MKAGEYSDFTTSVDRRHNGRDALPFLTLFAYRLIKTTMRSERGGVSQVCLCRRTHIHLRLATAGSVLIGVETGRSCGRRHTHTQTYIAAECCAGGALTSYRMCACLCTALISVRCTATAAQRPQCGCDTCQGERVREGEGGGGGQES